MRTRSQANRHVQPAGGLSVPLLAGVLASVLFSLGLAWGGMRLADPHTLPVQEVRIQGELDRLDLPALRERVAAAVHGGFFTVDVEAVRRAVEAEPWVAQAQVRRDWPDSLQVTVTERRPVAVWGDGALLDAEGRSFRPAAGPLPEGLPVLQGPPGSEAELLSRWRALERSLAPLGQHIAVLQLDARRAWSLRLASGPRVVLGRRDFDARWQRFLQHFPHTVAPRLSGLDTVDLRYTNGFALRPLAPAATAAHQPGGTSVHGEEG